MSFTPSSTGSRSASLSLSGNASNSPHVLQLTGNGLLLINPGGGAQGSVNVAPIPAPATIGTVPGGFAISDQVAYEITAQSQPVGPVMLAFVVPVAVAGTPQDFAHLRVLHAVNGTLVDVTAQAPVRDYSTRTIYALTTSFSPFYLAKRAPY